MDHRVKLAIDAMSVIGIAPQITRSVLKKLLEAYDSNWEYIEAENYRLLADSVFESQLDSRSSSLGKTGKEYVPSCLSTSSDQDSIAGSRKRPGKELAPASYKLTSGQNMSSCDFKVVSSCKREVNLLLQCSSALLEKKNFQMPSVKSVCKLVEDQFLHSAKKLDPKLSFVNLLKHMCDSVVEMGSQLAKRSTAQKKMMPSYKIDDDKRHERSKKKMRTMPPVVPVDTVKRIVNPRDITNGQERFKIPLVSEDIDYDPPSFHYIKNNVVYRNASVPVSLDRIGDEYCCSDCYGDCLRASVPCACAAESGGEYAYTSNGLLSENFLNSYIDKYRNTKDKHLHFCQNCPLERIKNEEMPDKCKGHLISTFIKECWTKCGCHSQCGNRVVQRGIRCRLEVFYSGKAKGWGLRSTEELPRGTFVCEYVGEILTNLELYERTMSASGNEKHTYPVTLDADWASEGLLEDEDALCLDATRYGNVARFMNHRCCDANTIEIPVEIETPDHHYYHVAFFTTRKIEAKEELCWDYGIDFSDINHPVKAFRCSCGSPFCRNKPLS